MQVEEMVRRIRCNALEYEEVFTPKKKKRPPEKWNPPHTETVKFNLDGAFPPGCSMGGWGVIARDSSGQVLAARAGRQENIQDAFGAEVNALAAAVMTASELGAMRVAFETDSQLLAEAMNARAADSSPYASIIEDLKYQMKMWFSKVSIIACRRSANSAAHELAKIGRMCLPNNYMEWNSIVPPSVVVCVSGDMPGHR